jgi:glycosyltransferase involved in cell wall biosynthesis
LSAARVLQVVLNLDPGGTQRLVLELAKQLNDEIPMAICCLDEAGAWASEAEQAGIGVTALKRRAGFHPGLGRLVARAARTHRATVVHAHHYSPFVYSCLARLWRPALRIVFTEHGRLSDAGPSRKRRVVNQVLRTFPAAVFAVSEDVRRHLIAEGFRPQDVRVIYNGIDIGPLPNPAARVAVREELAALDDDLVLGTIARLDPVKDLGTLLEAAAILSKRGPQPLVVIIGDGPERDALERRAAALGLADRVRFLGYRQDARRWLAGLDVYINSSVSEGVSLTILEAMAAALPVIATRVGGTPEVVTDDCGILVPARNARALANTVSQLGENPKWRRQLGAAARTRVDGHFTLDRMGAEYRQVCVRLWA